MRELTDKEIAQEERVEQMWLERWTTHRQDGEDLQTCTARLNQEQQMRLLWGMINMFEGKEGCEQLAEQAQQRYKHYSDLNNQGKYEDV